MDERELYELYHHGIKDMKWGKRRFQNPDGSLTPLGRIRYGVGKAREKIGTAAKAAGEKHKAKAAAKKEAKRIDELMKKPIRKLSEAELNERINRANKEKNLKSIEGDNQKATESFMSKLGSKFVNDSVIPAITNVGKKYLEKVFTKATGLDAEDMTNTFDILKKVGGDITKLTDKQREAYGKQLDVVKKHKGEDDSGKKDSSIAGVGDDDNIIEYVNSIGWDLTKLNNKQSKALATGLENMNKINNSNMNPNKKPTEDESQSQSQSQKPKEDKSQSQSQKPKEDKSQSQSQKPKEKESHTQTKETKEDTSQYPKVVETSRAVYKHYEDYTILYPPKSAVSIGKDAVDSILSTFIKGSYD